MGSYSRRIGLRVEFYYVGVAYGDPLGWGIYFKRKIPPQKYHVRFQYESKSGRRVICALWSVNIKRNDISHMVALLRRRVSRTPVP